MSCWKSPASYIFFKKRRKQKQLLVMLCLDKKQERFWARGPRHESCEGQKSPRIPWLYSEAQVVLRSQLVQLRTNSHGHHSHGLKRDAEAAREIHGPTEQLEATTAK